MDSSTQNSIDSNSYKPVSKLRSFNGSENITANDDTLNNNWASDKEKFDFSKNYSVTVYDVAAYVLSELGEITTMKLHKILYYCQAWSLVWDEKPLFDEEIEAWINGPVIRDLFNTHKGNFKLSTISIGNRDILNKNQKDTIDAVLGYYGNKSAQWLIELSHLEDPWKNAREGLKQNERGCKVITLDSMMEYYSSLL